MVKPWKAEAAGRAREPETKDDERRGRRKSVGTREKKKPFEGEGWEGTLKDLMRTHINNVHMNAIVHMHNHDRHDMVCEQTDMREDVLV